MQKSDFVSLLEVDFGPFRGAQVAAVVGISLKNDENAACDFCFFCKDENYGKSQEKAKYQLVLAFSRSASRQKNKTVFGPKTGRSVHVREKKKTAKKKSSAP